MLPFFLRPRKDQRRESKAAVAEKMWRENEHAWLEMLHIGKEHHIPIIFCVWDLTGLKSSLILMDKLKMACADYEDAFVLHLGPELIGIDNMEYKYAQHIYREQYTLRLDLHGNARQHKILADKTIELFLDVNRP